MREKLKEIVNNKYPNARIWEYWESNTACYMRFTYDGSLYLLDALKSGVIVNIFKCEETIRL